MIAIYSIKTWSPGFVVVDTKIKKTYLVNHMLVDFNRICSFAYIIFGFQLFWDFSFVCHYGNRKFQFFNSSSLELCFVCVVPQHYSCVSCAGLLSFFMFFFFYIPPFNIFSHL